VFRIDPLRGIPFRPGFSYTDSLNLVDKANYHIPFVIVSTGAYYLNGELINVAAYPMQDCGYYVAEYYDGIGVFHRIEFCFVPATVTVAAQALSQYMPQRNLAAVSTGLKQGRLGTENQALLFSKYPCFVQVFTGDIRDTVVLVADNEIKAPVTVYVNTAAKVISESDGSTLFSLPLTLQ